MTKEIHTPSIVIRKNKTYYICDHCGKEVDGSQVMKTGNGKSQFAYCPECMKELYPTYRKVKIYNSNSAMNQLLHEANARFEKNR